MIFRCHLTLNRDLTSNPVNRPSAEPLLCGTIRSVRLRIKGEEYGYSASIELQFDHFVGPLRTHLILPFANCVNRSLYEHRIPTNHSCGLYSTIGRNYDPKLHGS